MTARWGAYLGGGNEYEFPLIREQLRRRGVAWTELELKGGCGVAFHFDSSQLARLPADEKGPYLPVRDDDGHTIYRMEGLLERMRADRRARPEKECR